MSRPHEAVTMQQFLSTPELKREIGHRIRRCSSSKTGALPGAIWICLTFLPGVIFAQGSPALVSQASASRTIQPEAWKIVALNNRVRAAAGMEPLKWDWSLAASARQHCLRMAEEGPIAHRYGNEPDLSERALKAGSRFSLIEENVAIGPTPEAIHVEWMNSRGHRDNMMNPEVDRVGVAVVASRGVLYAAADYARAVPELTQIQVEAAVSHLVQAQGITVLQDTREAREHCEHEKSTGALSNSDGPNFLMIWQNADLSRLPKKLEERIASGRYHQAAVGSCQPQDVQGAFTAYRVAVLLY